MIIVHLTISILFVTLSRFVVYSKTVYNIPVNGTIYSNRSVATFQRNHEWPPPGRFRAEQNLKVQHVPGFANITTPSCDITVRKGGPEGPQVSQATLENHLYHRIDCSLKTGAPEGFYCLVVYNCTANDISGSVKWPIIDEEGCSLEPTLFDHVEYVNDLRAQIPNPVPIRFRDASGTVIISCRTKLVVKGHRAGCEIFRPRRCSWRDTEQENISSKPQNEIDVKDPDEESQELKFVNKQQKAKKNLGPRRKHRQ